jgi:hypothetical protein
MIGIHHQINHNCFDHLESQYVVGRLCTMEWASGCPLCEQAFHSIKIFGEGMKGKNYRNQELQGSTCENNIMGKFIESVELDPFKKIQGF